MPTTRIASANVKRGLGWDPLRRTTDRLLARGVGIIGFQEIYDHRRKQLRKYLARKGYGLAMAQDVPIAYDIKRYKLLDSGARRLPGQGSKDNSNPVRYGNWVALRDRRTGEVKIMTNTHLSRKRTARERSMQRRQIRELAELQRDLRKRYGKKADYYITGDMNNAKREMFEAFGLKGHRSGDKPIDWIFGEQRARRTRLMNTASDHDAFIATFRDRKRRRGGGGGGGGGGGDDMPNTPQEWAEYWATNGGSPGSWPSPFDYGEDGGAIEDRDGLNAFELFADLLESWGIPVGSDIEKLIKDAMRDGLTPDRIELLLPDIYQTKSFQQRFPGWQKRIDNGYAAIDVGQYLALENAYHRIMQANGLPAGFYDDPSDFGNWIANDVSPEEIQSRVNLAVDAAKQVDPTMRDIMARFYGLTTGDVASYFLDQKRALPIIEHQYETAGVASWAQRAGFEVTDMTRYEKLVNAGVTRDAAAQGYGTARSLYDSLSQAGDRYGISYDQGDAEQDVFFNQSDKRRKILANEQATFGGSSVGSTGSARRSSY